MAKDSSTASLPDNREADTLKSLNHQILKLQEQVADQDKALLVAHRLCWLTRLMPKSATQAEANRMMDTFRDAIGRDRAEQLESEWRAVKPKTKVEG